jgi:hypothetical protein
MWVTEPDQGREPPPVPLMRAPAGKELRVLLKGTPRRLFLHYSAGRTWPCTMQHCSLCKRSLSKRLYAFYPCYTPSLRPAILELTAQAESLLLQQMEQFTHEPRGVVRVTRSPVRRNSPVEIDWSEEPAAHAGLPDALSETGLEVALLRVWGLPARNGEATDDEWLARVAEVVRLRTTPRGG